ncbi:MAG: acetyl-CoA carboxylase biotin carboxyl carrier protein subunit [Acidobacteria bacterium]|nr:acetyl-CoA carboxylase biotin carboxyl carrier protein subunit [Acidobacteriota bacterium]
MELQIEIGGRVKMVSVEPAEGLFRVTIDGTERLVDAAAVDASTFSLICLSDGRTSQEVGLSETALAGEIAVHMASGVATARVLSGGASRFGRGAASATQAAGTQNIVSPMPGKVLKILVKKGDEVKVRQGLAVVEAMKMENEIRSPKDGTVADVLVSEGTSVEAGRLLVVVE